MTLDNPSQPVVLLFSGRKPGDWYGRRSVGSQCNDETDLGLCQRCVGLDLRRLCLKGPMNRLIQTTVQQLAVTAINVSLYSLCRERFPALRVVGACGHSVGEYSALYAAGAISLETLFRTLHFRASTMDAVSKSRRRDAGAEGADFATLSDIITRSGIALDISCDNTRVSR